jgi:ectoine hydroxylase-related dioxygenase (phytanoyl-CoA dioxygenase family)
MQIPPMTFNAHVAEPMAFLRDRGLVDKVAELEAFGYTVVQPEDFAPEAFIDRVRTATLKVAERRRGAAPDVVEGKSHANLALQSDQFMYFMALEDPVFQELLLNPVSLALITYLLGEDCVLSSMIAIVKGPGSEILKLHTDQGNTAIPFPAQALTANATVTLSDYTRENGALSVVPGSHRLCRPPTAAEMEDLSLQTPVETPAGSLIVWHGNLWHSAIPRTAAGLRINVLMYFSRVGVRPQENYRDTVSQEVLERNPPRFARLMSQEVHYGWGAEGPNYARAERARAARARIAAGS